MNRTHDRLARKHLSKADAALGRALKKLKLVPMKKSRGMSPYERLARAIIGQQISTAAAASIWARFKKLFDDGPIDFAKLSRLSDEKLRAVGVSPQKMGYLRDLAQKVSGGGLPSVRRLPRMSDDEIIAALLPIKGVGEWTIHMLLIFHFHRPNVWPVKDLGVKKGFMKVHGRRKLPDETWLLRFGERFSPYRSFAALYYWRALDGGFLP